MKNKWMLAACVAAALTAGVCAAAPAAKLNYRQADAIKRIDMNTGEVDRGLEEIAKKQAEFDQAAEPSLVPKRDLLDVSGRIKTFSNKLDNAERALKDLPADHAETKARVDKIAAQRAALAKADEAITNFGKNQGETGKKFDNVKADILKMKAMANAYAQFQLVQDPARVAVLAARYKEDWAAADEVAKLYKPLVNQKTPEGKEFNYWHTMNEENRTMFLRRAQGFVSEFQKTQDATYAEVLKMAEKAAAEKKPAFFGGGIQQQMETAKRQLDVYVGIAGEKHEKAIAAIARHAEQEKRVATLRDSLKAEIIATTKTPADLYKGADKAALKALVEAEWKKTYPDDQVMGVKFVTPEWKRNRGSTWRAAFKSWEDFDESQMTVRVVVKSTDKTANIYYAYLTKDHMSNDLVKAQTRTKGDSAAQEMLTSNYEP
jgi:hypothetical protein